MKHIQPGDRIVVTGATGFVGKILAEDLASAGYRVIGISEREEVPAHLANSLHDYHPVDLTRGWPKVGPFEGLVHLAGLAAVGPSFERPQDYIVSNSAMATHLFENALGENWQGRVIIASSGAVYDSNGDSTGLTECSPLLASSPYVVSKLLVENQTAYYVRRGVDAVVARPFNHIGPGQLPGFIVPDLTAKVRKWRPDSMLTVRNLDSARDYTDVRDIARAYRLLLELDEPLHTTYNVCSGNVRSGWEVLEAICKALGKPKPPTQVKADRAIDPSLIRGNGERIKLETGWQPIIELQKSINDYVSATA